MKTSIEKIRHYACGELLLYRSIYNQYNKLPYVTNDYLEHLYKHYIMITWICACGLISLSTAARAYYMYATIRQRRYNKWQSATN